MTDNIVIAAAQSLAKALINSEEYYVKQLLGCTAVGKHHIDIDGDKLPDISNSKSTLDHIMKILPNKFKCIYTIDNSLNKVYGI